MKIEVIKQFSVFVPNRPGALSSLARLFSDRGINIVGIASEVRDDSGVIRVAVESKTDVSGLLSQAGLASVETDLLSVEVADKPGELFRFTSALAEAKVNVTTVYGTAQSGHSTRILIAVENISKARQVLEKLGAAR